MFVCEHFNVVPDMLVIGKGLGGGVFPLAALIVKEDLDITGDKALGHYTHEKSSVGCAAALATIDCLYENKLIENSINLGKKGLDYLKQMRSQHPIISDVRGLGLFFGIELQLDSQPALKEAEEVLYHSLSNGLSYKIGGGNVLTLCPPLTITEKELFSAFDIIDEGLQKFGRKD
jgi:4-aminobutyrate aminotransferase